MANDIIKKVIWNDQKLEVVISPNNTCIRDSYLVKSRKDMKNILNQIRLPNFSDYACDKRSIKSMIREWRGHNLLYSLGLWKARTKDVDLNYPQGWYEKVGYFILSIFYWPSKKC